MKVYLSDWLTNAGILGYLRIQKLRGKTYDLSENHVEIRPEDLTGFEEAYFSLALLRGLGFFFQFRSLKKLQKPLGDEQYFALQRETRELIDRAKLSVVPIGESFDTTVKAIDSVIGELLHSTKDAITARTPSDNALRKKVSKILDNLDNEAGELSTELGNPKRNYITTQLKRFYFNKAIVGNYGLRGGDRKLSFREEYIMPAQAILGNPTSAEGVTCRFCKQNRVNISDLREVNKFFGEGLFSPVGVTLGFQNFFYCMQPDLVICDICELILLCAWAGFTEIPWKFRDEVNDTEFIYVNVPSLQLLWEENQKIQNLYDTADLDLQGTVYEEIVYDLLVKERRLRSQWALQNTLFVEIKPVPRKDQGKPNFRYLHIGKDIAEAFTDDFAAESLKRVKGRIYNRRNKETPRNSVFVYARRDAVRRLVGRDSLYPLCYAALRDQIEYPSMLNVTNVFNLSLISAIRKNIWIKYKIGDAPMESKQVFGILKAFSSCGESLGAQMDFDKRKRLSYRLLSLIRTGKTADLYEALMKFYISQNRPIPDVLVTMLNKEDAIEPEAKAYAFMSGFLGEHQVSTSEHKAST